jgi:hypothetical protein
MIRAAHAVKAGLLRLHRLPKEIARRETFVAQRRKVCHFVGLAPPRPQHSSNCLNHSGHGVALPPSDGTKRLPMPKSFERLSRYSSPAGFRGPANRVQAARPIYFGAPAPEPGDSRGGHSVGAEGLSCSHADFWLLWGAAHSDFLSF